MEIRKAILLHECSLSEALQTFSAFRSLLHCHPQIDHSYVMTLLLLHHPLKIRQLVLRLDGLKELHQLSESLVAVLRWNALGPCNCPFHLSLPVPDEGAVHYWQVHYGLCLGTFSANKSSASSLESEGVRIVLALSGTEAVLQVAFGRSETFRIFAFHLRPPPSPVLASGAKVFVLAFSFRSHLKAANSCSCSAGFWAYLLENF